MAFASSVRALTNDWPGGAHAARQIIHEEEGRELPLVLIANSACIQTFLMYKMWRSDGNAEEFSLGNTP